MSTTIEPNNNTGYITFFDNTFVRSGVNLNPHYPCKRDLLIVIKKKKRPVNATELQCSWQSQAT